MAGISRKPEASVVVGGGPRRPLKVTVLRDRSGIVKMGLAADDMVPVNRWEVSIAKSRAPRWPRRYFIRSAHLTIRTQPWDESSLNKLTRASAHCEFLSSS